MVFLAGYRRPAVKSPDAGALMLPEVEICLRACLNLAQQVLDGQLDPARIIKFWPVVRDETERPLESVSAEHAIGEILAWAAKVAEGEINPADAVSRLGQFSFKMRLTLIKSDQPE